MILYIDWLWANGRTDRLNDGHTLGSESPLGPVRKRQKEYDDKTVENDKQKPYNV